MAPREVLEGNDDCDLMKIVAERSRGYSGAEPQPAPSTDTPIDRPTCTNTSTRRNDMRLSFFSKDACCGESTHHQHLEEGTVPQEVVAVSPERIADSHQQTQDLSLAVARAEDGDASQYELICGLSVHLSKDAEIRYEEADGSLLVRANLAILGDSLFTARGLCLRAKLVGSEVHDLVVHVEKLVVDPLVTRNQLLDFLERFGLPKEENEQHGEARATRMSHEEWKQFLQNAKQDTRHIPDNTTLVSWDDMATVDECGGCHRMDLKIPLARVMATQCELAAYNGAMEFPDCQGSEAATVRTLLEYYARSVLNQMDLWNGDKADVSLKAVASDVASVKYSMIGAGVGAVLLGPAGYVAGCYLGDRFIRNLGSSSLTCGLAGAALFGPAGLVAGAVASTADVDKPVERRQSKSTAVIDQAGKASRKGVVQSATDHVKASKYEYGGTTGVVAGAMVGLAVAGPVGLIAGSVAGSMGGRKLVEKTTTPVAQNDGQQPQAEGQGNKKPYQFGDFTRGVLARGKQARHANSGGGYRFGDFTRGLMSRKQAS